MDTEHLEPSVRDRHADWNFKIASVLGLFVLSGLFSVLVSNHLGMSLWWDTFNYQYYNGWAVLHGFGTAFALPGQSQTYQDLIPDVGYYLALGHLGSLHGSELIALVESLGPAVLGSIVFLFAQSVHRGKLESLGLGVAAGALAAGCPVYLTELGTTASDTVVAAIVFAGGGLLGAALCTGSTRRQARLALIAGFVLGFGTVVKFIALPGVVGLYAGFGLALLAGTDRQGSVRSRVLLWVKSAGTAAGTAVVLYTPLGIMLWRRYRNPFFPYFNKVANSPYQRATNFHDGRFQARGFHDWIVHLKGLLVGTTHLESGGLTQRSPLMVVGVLLLFGLLISDIIKRRGALAIFIETTGIVAFVGWSATVVIYRYAAMIEMSMATLFIVLALDRTPQRRSLPWAVVVACGLLAWLGGAGIPAPRAAFGTLFDTNISALRARNSGHIVIAVDGAAVGYLATYLPASTDLVRLGGTGNLHGAMSPLWWKNATAHIKTTPGPWMIIIVPNTERATQISLQTYGLTATMSDCTAIGGQPNHQVAICDLNLGPF